MNVFCVMSLHDSFNSHNDTEACYDRVRGVALPTEVAFPGLLPGFPASLVESVFGIFTIGPGRFVLFQATPLHCMLYVYS